MLGHQRQPQQQDNLPVLPDDASRRVARNAQYGKQCQDNGNVVELLMLAGDGNRDWRNQKETGS